MTGSRIVPLSEVMSIFARRHHLPASSSPAHMRSNSASPACASSSRCFELARCSRSSRICSCGVSSMYALPSRSSCRARSVMSAKWSDVCESVTNLGSSSAMPSERRSRRMFSSNSSFSFDGLVSSKRMRRRPLYRFA